MKPIVTLCNKEKKFVWGVQWHPEFDYHYNAASKAIFDAFVDACKG